MFEYSKIFETEFTRNTLRLPQASLQGCIRGFLTRDIAQTSVKEFKSIFPASPFPAIGWTINGNRDMVNKPGLIWPSAMPDKIVYHGIRPNWFTCRDSPGLSLFCLVFQPDAPFTLFGMDATNFMDNAVEGSEALPADWMEMSNRLIQAPNHDIRQKIVEDFLEPRWAATRRNTPFVPHSLTDWLTSAVSRVVISKPGGSIRQLERRIQRMIGLSHRNIKTLDRGEKTMMLTTELIVNEKELNLSKLAIELGYFDQAHFCNETKRMTGLTPTEIYQLVNSRDDALWVFQLWK